MATETPGGSETPPRYAFGAFILDPAEQRLLMNGVPVPITPKVFDTLQILVEHRGRLVDKQDLTRRLWPDTFVTDAALARHVSDLRKALGEQARGGRYIETIPTRGYRFIADVRELWPEGNGNGAPSNADARQQDEPDDEPSQASVHIEEPASLAGPAAGSRSRLWIAAVLLAVVVTVAMVSWSTTRLRSGGVTTVQSLAVLPFETFGQSENDRMIAMGFTDTLITRLAHASEVTLRPIGAVLQYADRPGDPVDAGRRLRVDAVLTGSIRRDGSTLRITAHLVRVHDGRFLWSGRFDDEATTLFAIEETMATQVASAMSPVLRSQTRARLARRETNNAEANLAYLRGMFFLARRTTDGMQRAVAHLEQAVRTDPAFSLAYAGLADAYILLGGPAPEPEMIARARAAALKALEIDSTLGEAHASLALIAMNYDWDWTGAEREYRTAIQLSPQCATAHAWYGEYLAYMGRFDEGLAEIERARDLDPLSLIINTDAAKILMLARRYDQAVVQLRQTLDLDPSYPLARMFLALSYSALGRHAEAIESLQLSGQENDPILATTRTTVYANAGRMADARAAFDHLMALSARGYVTPFLVAYAHIALADFDAAFAALDRMCEHRGLGAISVKVNPLFDPIRRDPRFGGLLRRLRFEP